MNVEQVVQHLKDERNRFDRAIQALEGSGRAGNARKGHPGLSKAARAKIAAAQRKRWAKQRAKSGQGNVVAMPKTMSAAARARIAAAQKARWAKAKGAKKG